LAINRRPNIESCQLLFFVFSLLAIEPSKSIHFLNLKTFRKISSIEKRVVWEPTSGLRLDMKLHHSKRTYDMTLMKLEWEKEKEILQVGSTHI